MGWNRNAGKEVVSFGMEFLEDGGDVEAINEEGGTTGAFGMREEME